MKVCHKVGCIGKILIRLSRETDNEISSYVDHCSIRSLERSECSEDFFHSFARIVAIHRLENRGWSRLYREMNIGIDAYMFEESDNFFVEKFNTKGRNSNSLNVSLLEYCFDKNVELRHRIVIWTVWSPCSEIYACQDYFRSSFFDKCIYFFDNFDNWSPFMASARLYRETKSTKIITSGLNNNIFSRENLFSLEFLKGSYFCLHHSFFLFLCHDEITGIFRENFYFFFPFFQFVVYSIKIRIDHTVSDISASGEIEFFLLWEFWKNFECFFYPFCFCFIGNDTRCNKISVFIGNMRVDEPFFCEVFVGFTTKNSIIQRKYI